MKTKTDLKIHDTTILSRLQFIKTLFQIMKEQILSDD